MTGDEVRDATEPISSEAFEPEFSHSASLHSERSLSTEVLTAIVTADLSGVCRGRTVPNWRVADALANGIGWVPANLALTPFATLATPNPFGSKGDLRLVPDATTLIRLPGDMTRPPLGVMLGDLEEPDGTAWNSCPRAFLKSALRDLEMEAGLTMKVAFEHEFVEIADGDREQPFSLQALLTGEPFGSTLVRVLADVGLQPETWLAEFGMRQWEITLKPAAGLVAADRAILLRETVRSVARNLGRKVTFSPVPTLGDATSGVHVHLSLWRTDGRPATFDAEGPGRLSDEARSFAAGVLTHSRALLALTAGSAISFERLRPGNWSAGLAILGDQEREALLRIPATVERNGRDPAPQFNLEYRGADATANPWIVLGAIVHAGLEGLRASMAAPRPGGSMGAVESQRFIVPAGIGEVLPSSLGEALDALESDAVARAWLPSTLFDTYLAVKREELELVTKLDDIQRCKRYVDAY